MVIPPHYWYEMQDKNTYHDNDTKRLHLKGIDAAYEYLARNSNTAERCVMEIMR